MMALERHKERKRQLLHCDKVQCSEQNQIHWQKRFDTLALPFDFVVIRWITAHLPRQ